MATTLQTFTTGKLAQLAGIHQTTVNSLIHRGLLKAHRLPGSQSRWLVTREEAGRLLATLGKTLPEAQP